MKKAHPLFDPETKYRIEVRGRIDIAWLESFDGSVEIVMDEARQMEDITALEMKTDQSGIVGLVLRLHGLGIAILQIKIILPNSRNPSRGTI